MFGTRIFIPRLALLRSASQRQAQFRNVFRSISGVVDAPIPISDKLDSTVEPDKSELLSGPLDPWERQRASTKPLECTICSKRFNSKTNVERHIAEVHKIPRPLRPAPVKIKNKKVLDPWNELKANPWACPICSKAFKVKANVGRHIISMHKIPRPPKPSKPAEKLCPQCHVCGKFYVDNRNLRRHLEHHMDTLRCSSCDALAPDIRQLRKHVCGEKHECALCGLGFTTESFLSAHTKVCKGNPKPGDAPTVLPMSEIPPEQSPNKRRTAIQPFIGPLRQQRTRQSTINDSFLGTHTRKGIRLKDMPEYNIQTPYFDEEALSGDIVLTHKEKAHLTPSMILRRQRASSPVVRVWTTNAQRKKRRQRFSKDTTLKIKLSEEASQLSKTIERAYDEKNGKGKRRKQPVTNVVENSQMYQSKHKRKSGPVISLDTKRVHVVSKELCGKPSPLLVISMR
jgi:hypothetical protein